MPASQPASGTWQTRRRGALSLRQERTGRLPPPQTVAYRRRSGRCSKQ